MPTLKSKLSRRDVSFSEVVREMNEATSHQAEQWYGEKRKVSIVETLLRMLHRFTKIYFVKGGVLRGFGGFRDAANSALFQLLCYAKYWELIEREQGRM